MSVTFITIGAITASIIGAFVSRAKNRAMYEGILLGLFLNVLGIFIAALLPNKEK